MLIERWSLVGVWPRGRGMPEGVNWLPLRSIRDLRGCPLFAQSASS
jgi:hypothetical protein